MVFDSSAQAWLRPPGAPPLLFPGDAAELPHEKAALVPSPSPVGPASVVTTASGSSAPVLAAGAFAWVPNKQFKSSIPVSPTHAPHWVLRVVAVSDPGVQPVKARVQWCVAAVGACWCMLVLVGALVALVVGSVVILPLLSLVSVFVLAPV